MISRLTLSYNRPLIRFFRRNSVVRPMRIFPSRNRSEILFRARAEERSLHSARFDKTASHARLLRRLRLPRKVFIFLHIRALLHTRALRYFLLHELPILFMRAFPYRRLFSHACARAEICNMISHRRLFVKRRCGGLLVGTTIYSMRFRTVPRTMCY